MDYPLFLIPHIGGSWLIGAVAIFHVIIAHFAIGGGLLTVATEQLGARRGNALWLTFARKHAAFLVLLSSVLGALSGVGIWFTVGLVHPAAVASLIHNFVWGWAIEWVFFIVEMAAALLAAEERSPATCEQLAAKLGLNMDKYKAYVAHPATDQEIDRRVEWLDEKTYPGLPMIWIENQELLGVQTFAALYAAWNRAERHKTDNRGMRGSSSGSP